MSTARLIDEAELDEAQSGTTGENTLLVEEQSSAPKGEVDETIPEKYRNKSAAELLDIVRNQESLIGRHSTELGDLRNQNGTLRGNLDAALDLRATGNVTPQETEDDLDDDAFTLNPQDATKRTIKQETQSLADKVDQLTSQAETASFITAHPTANDDFVDPKFIEFVQKSEYRMGLAQSAFGNGEKNIDYNAAGQLWDAYDDYKSYQPTEESKEPKAEAEEDASTSEAPEGKKAPSMITGGGSGGGDNNSGQPIYSQAKLNDLMMKDPDMYYRADTQAKIAAAYAEGRVKQDI